MNFDDIELIFFAVQLKNGSAHQVITTKENKELALSMIARMDGQLRLDKEIEPIELEYKK